MTLQKLVYGMLLVSLLAACGGTKKSDGPKSTTLIDALTDFSIAINANNYEKAVDFLVESEKKELVDFNGKVIEEAKKKLKALRLQILIKNPRIQLSGSKLVGILSALPSLQHTGPAEDDPEAESSTEGDDPLKVDTQLDNIENSEDSGEEGSEE